MAEPLKGSALRWLTVAIAVAIGWTLVACGDSGSSQPPYVIPPARLLESNDFLALSALVYVEEIADLGHVKYLEKDFDYRLVEYTFRPIDLVKSPTDDSLVFLWYCVGFCRNTNWGSGLPTQPDWLDLVYGNQLTSADSIINVLRPRFNCTVTQFLHALERNEAGPHGGADTLDLELADRLLGLDDIGERLALSDSLGLVIYGTDFLYQTHYSFHNGRLVWGEWGSRQKPQTWSSRDYMQELVELSR